VRQVAAALRFERWNGADRVSRSWAAGPGAAAVDVPATPPVAAAVSVAAPAPAPAALAALRARIGVCTLCGHAASRQQIVHGMGNPHARLMIVGAEPDAASDASGLPWQGQVGDLLAKMLTAMGTSRDETWMTYLTLCRGPGVSDADDSAIRTCSKFLRTQIETIRPEVILLCGELPSRFLLRSQAPWAQLRGQWFKLLGFDALPTHDPAILLQQPALKREAWSDLQMVMKRLRLTPPTR